MNQIDHLSKNPFSINKFDEKLAIKKLGAHQPPNFNIEKKDKTVLRKFNKKWFEITPWLTVSEEKQTLLCFYCVLFKNSGDQTWSVHGTRDLKHLSEKIKRHETSSAHITCSMKYQMLGAVDIAKEIDESQTLCQERHNKIVARNGHVLNRVIDSLKFSGRNELPIRGHDERESSEKKGVFLEFLFEQSKSDGILESHLKSEGGVKNTSKTIQNELLDCMYDIYIDELQKEIAESSFVAVQSDDTSDIACKSQCVIVLRYMKGNLPRERFLKFVEVHDRTGAGLASIIRENIEIFGLKDKLIAQTYDGAAAMSGNANGVQKIRQETYKYAIFIHCYAHQLNLVVKKMCSSVTDLNFFFANLTVFSQFFKKSPKKSDLLEEEESRRIPRAVPTRWTSISAVNSTVLAEREKFIKVVFNIFVIFILPYFYFLRFSKEFKLNMDGTILQLMNLSDYNVIFSIENSCFI
jgi:Domain of unknown function (DUF4371)